MKKIAFIVPALIIITAAAGINNFSCSKAGQGVLFGNSGESPIKSEIESTKAFEIQNVFRKIFIEYLVS